MGSLCCCFKKDDYDEDDPNSETRRILDHPVGINDGDRRNSQTGIMQTGQSHYGSTAQANGGGRQSYENTQTQLYNRVLNQLSARVIDISSIEKSGEEADISDRENAIYKKLSTVRKSVVLDSNKPLPSTRSDHSHPKSKDPIPMDDYRLITNIATKSASAVDYGFRIHNSEPFVVNF